MTKPLPASVTPHPGNPAYLQNPASVWPDRADVLSGWALLRFSVTYWRAWTGPDLFGVGSHNLHARQGRIIPNSSWSAMSFKDGWSAYGWRRIKIPPAHGMRRYLHFQVVSRIWVSLIACSLRSAHARVWSSAEVPFPVSRQEKVKITGWDDCSVVSWYVMTGFLLQVFPGISLTGSLGVFSCC